METEEHLRIVAEAQEQLVLANRRADDADHRCRELALECEGLRATIARLNDEAAAARAREENLMWQLQQRDAA